MRKRIVALIMATVVASAMITGCGSKAADGSAPAKDAGAAPTQDTAAAGDTIKIGVSGPTTGSQAEAGVHVNTGIQMAVDEVNEAGGITIDGKQMKVEVVYYDTGSDAQTGLSNCEKLVTSDKVDFLFCEAFNSAVGIATMELAK